MDDDGGVVGVLEGGGGAGERRVVELPGGGDEFPDQAAELRAVGGVLHGEPAALGGEVELVPPGVLGGGRQRIGLRGHVGDEVSAGGDERLDALGPQRGDDVGGARAPVEAGEDRLVDL